jgi:hypothetical protein
MTFLDLTEGDKLAVVVVELHVGRGARESRSGICCVLPSLKEPLLGALSSRMTFCAAFLKEPLSGALSSRMTFLDLTEGDKLAVVVVELHVGPRRQCDALGNQDQV